MKIVINKCFGGFSLSHAAVMRYAELKGFTLYPWLDRITRDVYKKKAVIGGPGVPVHYSRVPVDGLPETKFGWPDIPADAYFASRHIERTDPALVQVVEELGENADGDYAKLVIVEIPDGVEWEIDEYDGREHIAETHRTWG